MELQKKTVVITGAGRGLGRAVAESLAARGARLALVDLNQDNLSDTAEACEKADAEVRCYTADVSSEQDVETLFEQIVNDFSAVHGLINNAGVTRDGLLVKGGEGKIDKKMSLEAWQTVINVNLTGVFLCAREAAAQMIEQGNEGLIVNISSISRAGNAGQTNYTAAKAGVAGMTVTWAKELARHGIRVAAIAPGFVDTPMVRSMKDSARERLIGMIPLHRLAVPGEIAKTVLYLFDNDYVTGRVIEVDGGLRL